jgi:hypothetical protein
VVVSSVAQYGRYNVSSRGKNRHGQHHPRNPLGNGETVTGNGLGNVTHTCQSGTQRPVGHGAEGIYPIKISLSVWQKTIIWMKKINENFGETTCVTWLKVNLDTLEKIFTIHSGLLGVLTPIEILIGNGGGKLWVILLERAEDIEAFRLVES